jgi:hypothetical protein
MDIICILWRAEQRGSLTHQPVIWARILRCSKDEFHAVIDELFNFKVADVVTECNGDVTVSCRRMLRDEKDRNNTKLRVQRYRNSSHSNGLVTPYKSEVISHKSELNKENTVASAKPVEFEIFWKEYPRKIGKKKALKVWTAAKDKPALADILKSVQVAKLTDQWKKDGGKYIPHPSTWLNEGRWDDEVKGGTVIDWDKFRTTHKEQA